MWSVGATCGRPPNERLSKYGMLVDEEIKKINEVYDNVVIVDNYVIMPNHIHMIIIIKNCCYDDGRPKVAPTLSRIIQQFKGAVTKKCNFLIWERSFYDHIINNEHEYHYIQQYIKSNPENWQSDYFYSSKR